MGDTSNISSLLAARKPRIIVDEDGGELLLSLSFAGSCLIFNQLRGSFAERMRSRPKLPR